jgi:type II secretory pathway pseudopilin PulG
MFEIARRHVTAQAGYAMAALMVVLMVAGILLTRALPLWATLVKREREAELIWRGTQYARAIDLFRQKYGYMSPPDVDTLLRERFLRKRYTDPMTGDSDFQLLYAIQLPNRDLPENLADPLRQPRDAEARGGIIGVVSRSPDTSLRRFNGASTYNEWAFSLRPCTVGVRRAVFP